MVICSQLNIIFNLFRVLMVVILLSVLPFMIKVVIDNGTNMFSLFIAAQCLMLLYFVYQALSSVNRVYKSVVISDAGIAINNILGLGKPNFLTWSAIDQYKVDEETSMRVPKYRKIRVEHDQQCILEMDDLTYRNYKQMEAAIIRYVDASRA